jgi:pyruvate dehydrogenase (quinone)
VLDRPTGSRVRHCRPRTAHLINGLLDARKGGAPVIAIAGDVESSIIDSEALEELNPYSYFASAALYVGSRQPGTGA